MKTRNPRQPKQPIPVSKDDTLVVVPDIEDLVVKRMQSMQDAKELKKKEIIKLIKGVSHGITIVPVLIFTNQRGRIKIKIALSRGKKNYDKRVSIKERELSRELKKS